MIRHGVDGWHLAEYEWDPATQCGTFIYVHRDGRTHETARAQPIARRRN